MTNQIRKNGFAPSLLYIQIIYSAATFHPERSMHNDSTNHEMWRDYVNELWI